MTIDNIQKIIDLCNDHRRCEGCPFCKNFSCMFYIHPCDWKIKDIENMLKRIKEVLNGTSET